MISLPQEHLGWSDTLLVINLGGGHVCYLEHRNHRWHLTSYSAQHSPQMSMAPRLRNPDLDTECLKFHKQTRDLRNQPDLKYGKMPRHHSYQLQKYLSDVKQTEEHRWSLSRRSSFSPSWHKLLLNNAFGLSGVSICALTCSPEQPQERDFHSITGALFFCWGSWLIICDSAGRERYKTFEMTGRRKL